MPPWVPPDLADEFRRAFIALGEHEAAARIRMILRRRRAGEPGLGEGSLAAKKEGERNVAAE